MVADVPVGSITVDSGSIAAVSFKELDRLATTCGFDMNEVTGREANLTKKMLLSSKSAKTEQFEQVMNAGDVRWSLPKLVYHLEDLRVGCTNYYIARLASKFVKFVYKVRVVMNFLELSMALLQSI